MFTKHPSDSLKDLYIIKNYQGANPQDAKILFVGKDPNWSSTIDTCEIYELVKEYLSDGVSFWKKYNIHHPFLHPKYKGDGKKYHQAVSRINLSSENADKISFIEIIGFPTTGMSSLNPKLFNEHLLSDENRNHLVELDELLNNPKKSVFLFWGMIDQLKFINKHTGLFSNFLNIDKSLMNRTSLNKIGNLYFHKHFSMGISSSTLKKIGEEVSTNFK
ncbi:hypothetical protein [Flavobacterium sp.]